MSHSSTPPKASSRSRSAYPTPPTPTRDATGRRATYINSSSSVPSCATDPQVLDILSYESRHYRAEEPHMHYDMREPPSRAMIATPSNGHPLSSSRLAAAVISPGATTIKVISRVFPWEINIVGERGGVVTVSDLINACHKNLSGPVARPEWWIVSDRARKEVTAAFEQNTKGERPGGIRRIDWLRNQVILKGLERDEAFIAERVPDVGERANTWVLVTASI